MDCACTGKDSLGELFHNFLLSLSLPFGFFELVQIVVVVISIFSLQAQWTQILPVIRPESGSEAYFTPGSILDFPLVLKIFNFPLFRRTDQQALEE